MTRRAPPEARGFTLMEVMLAVAIVAIMSSLVWGSFGRLLNVTREIESADAYWQGLRVAMGRLTREVGVAFLSEHFDPNEYRKEDQGSRPTFFLLEDGGERDRLAFTAFVNRRLFLDEKTSRQAVVEYYLDEDDDDRTHLYRRQKNVLDRDWDRDGEAYVLVEDVEAFDVQWWDPENESWENEWDTARDGRTIPRRFRFRITTLGPEGEPQTYVTQARVMMPTSLTW